MIIAGFIFILGLLGLILSTLILFNGLSKNESFTWDYKPWVFSWIIIGLSAQYVWG